MIPAKTLPGMTPVATPCTPLRAAWLKSRALLWRAHPLLPVLLFLAGAALVWPATIDDGFISLRYAWEFVQGHGLVYSPGPHVQGFTNPALVLFEALLLWAHVPAPMVAVKLLGVVCGCGVLWLVRPRPGQWLVLGLGLVGALSLPLLAGAVDGLETLPFAVLVLWGAARLAAGDDRGLALLGLAALVRPEGYLFLALYSLLRLRRRPLLVLLAWTGPLAYEGWAWSFYGTVVPSTWLLKHSGAGLLAALGAWLPSARSFLMLDGNALLVALAALAAWRRPRVRPAALCALLYALFVASQGRVVLMGDWYRFYVPLLGLLLWLAAEGLRGIDAGALRPVARRWCALACVALLAWNAALIVPARASGLGLDPTFTAIPLGRTGPALERAHARLGAWLRVHAPSTHSLVALQDAGTIAYEAQLPALDTYSLSDLRIIALERRGDAAQVRTYVLSRQPTYLVGTSWQLWGLPADPRFRRAYRLLRTPTFQYLTPQYRLLVYERAACLDSRPLRPASC